MREKPGPARSRSLAFHPTVVAKPVHLEGTGCTGKENGRVVFGEFDNLSGEEGNVGVRYPKHVRVLGRILAYGLAGEGDLQRRSGVYSLLGDEECLAVQFEFKLVHLGVV